MVWPTTMSESSGGTETQVPTQLTNLVPQFDPAQHDLEQYTQKVELLSSIWPATKMNELITRLILGTSGAAFQKLQLQRSDMMTGDQKGVERLVTILGGQWGKISLEKKYETFEKAIYRCQQRNDESNDSYLARADVLWTELLASKVSLPELQAYAILRGSQLSAEDKKRVILESEATTQGVLEMCKVNAAVRMLGSGFFHDVTGAKKVKGKIYDNHALIAEDVAESERVLVAEETFEEDFVDQLAAEGDDDAILVCEYESAMQDTIQEDEELAQAYNAYTEARKRLSDRFKNRGFWPSSGSFKGKSKGFKGKGKSSLKGSRKSLQQRILEPNCRICGRKGHWKSECPDRPRSTAGQSSSSQAPTMTVSTMPEPFPSEETLPLEFTMLPEVHDQPIDDTSPQPAHVHVCNGVNQKGCKHPKLGYYLAKWRDNYKWGINSPANQHPLRSEASLLRQQPRQNEPATAVHFAEKLAKDEQILFASHGTHGILDTGATKTVMGSNQVPELLQQLHPEIRKRTYRCQCKITFRFGNEGTLDSQHAIVIPLGQVGLKIAIVPGGTPLLLSNSLLRTLKAQVDVSQKVLVSPFLKKPVSLNLNGRGLFLVDINELALSSRTTGPSAETFMHETLDAKSIQETGVSPVRLSSHVMSENTAEMMQTQNAKHTQSHATHAQSTPNQAACSNHQFHDAHKNVQDTHNHDHQFETQHSPQKVMYQKDDRDALTSQPGSEKSFDRSPPPPHCQHEPIRAPEPPQLLQGRSRGDGEIQVAVTGRDGIVTHHLRKGTFGPSICRDLESRSQVAPMVCAHLRDVPKDRSHEAAALRDPHDREVRDGGNHGAVTDASSSSQAKAEKPTSPDGVRGPRRGGCLARDAEPTDILPERHGVREHHCAAVAHESVGGSCERDSRPAETPIMSDSLWAMGLQNAGDLDSDDVCCSATQVSQYQRQFQELVQQLSKEFQNAFKLTEKCQGSQLQVLEVFCGPQSELTHQAKNLGYRAERFGFQQGDLSTIEGREKLFHLIVQRQPQNLWFSPTCGPWSAWNNLNAAKSVSSFDSIHRQRLQHLYQIALGVVLFRYQYSQKRHFHWEQPRRSLMFMTPLLREIYEYTYSAKFDMCNVGSLKDPENHQFIQKGLEVRTTSHVVYSQLHGRFCRHDHEHQVLEGSTVHQGVRKNRTEFSENYPRKFARSLAKMLTSFGNTRSEPKDFSQWNEVFAAAVKRQSSTRAGTKESPAKRIRTNTAKKSEPLTDSNKRKRKDETNPKDFNMTQRDDLYDLCNKVHSQLPRVGRKEILESEIIQNIQEIIGEKKVVRILACKGTERMLAPPKNMMHGEAPFRKTIALERGTKRVWIENEWEEWETLSQRQLIRGLIPCAVNITVFGCNPSEISPSSAEIQPRQESQSNVPEGRTHPTPVMERTAQDSATEPSPCKPKTETSDQDLFSRNLQIDCENVNQGPKFKSLSGYGKTDPAPVAQESWTPIPASTGTGASSTRISQSFHQRA